MSPHMYWQSTQQNIDLLLGLPSLGWEHCGCKTQDTCEWGTMSTTDTSVSCELLGSKKCRSLVRGPGMVSHACSYAKVEYWY